MEHDETEAAWRVWSELTKQVKALEFVLGEVIALLEPEQIVRASNRLRTLPVEELVELLDSLEVVPSDLRELMPLADIVPDIRNCAGNLLVWLDD